MAADHTRRAAEVEDGDLALWLEAHEYTSVAQARGSVSYATSDNPGAFERANYLATIHSRTAPPTS